MRFPGKAFDCPVCGAAVGADAKACPECGACERSGWSGEAVRDGLDLPDREFDHDAFVQEEFGSSKAPRPAGISPIWWITALIVLVAFLMVNFLR
jgi:hypothetical protein